MTYEMNLNKKPFDLIESGLKNYEIRLYDEKRQKIKVGDNIVFIETDNIERKLSVSVVEIRRYKSFSDLYKDIPKTCMGYEEGEECSFSDMYLYYTPEKERLYGVVAIGIKKL